MTPLNLSESETRYLLIDPLHIKAEWNLAARAIVSFEVPVDGYHADPTNGITDYYIFRNNGNLLAVVEVKKTLRVKVGKEQLWECITKIEKRQNFLLFVGLTEKLAA